MYLNEESIRLIGGPYYYVGKELICPERKDGDERRQDKDEIINNFVDSLEACIALTDHAKERFDYICDLLDKDEYLMFRGIIAGMTRTTSAIVNYVSNKTLKQV